MKNKLWIGVGLAVLAIVVVGVLTRIDKRSYESHPQTVAVEQPAEAAHVVPVDAVEAMPRRESSSDAVKPHADSGCAGCAHHAAHSDAETESERPAMKITEAVQKELFLHGKNSPISFALPGDGTAEGTVELTREENGKTVMVQGSLTAPQKGFFFFQLQSAPGVAGPMVGTVTFDEGEIAYAVEPDADGKPVLQEKDIDDVICRRYEKPEALKKPSDGAVENIPADHPDNVYIPDYQNGVIPLSSLPGATGVVYLDFDGEEGPHEGWPNSNFDAASFNLNNATIKSMWVKVAEDFAPFNLNITTDLQVYLDAPEESRTRCIITPTDTVAPGAGGVALFGRFNYTGDIPCWVFQSGNNGAMAISHEVGHTLNLSHDGTVSANDVDPTGEYYGGHGSGEVSWGPIMGAPYAMNVVHWSKGDYYDANLHSDDLDGIDTLNNNVDYRADDHANTYAAATYLEIHPDNTVSNNGIIERTTDVDGFRFTTTASGNVSFTVSPVNEGPNLDIKAEIVESDGTTVVAIANPADTLAATVSKTGLPAGDYILRVDGVGVGTPLANPPSGYTDYGSLGFYTVTGTVPNGEQPDRFTIAENPTNSTLVGTISQSGTTYSITSGNASGAFAINASSGQLTVADAAQFDFEVLSTYYDDPATFELFVDVDGSEVRVVVEVTDVNETPTISAGGTFTLLEHTQPGTLVTQLSTTDPDHYDHATFSITAGNTGSAFAIDSDSGVLTFAADTDATVQSNYNLTVTASDQGTPTMTNSTTVTINLIDIQGAYTPGTVNQAYYLDISGADIIDLTSAAKYPLSPDELYVRTVMGSTDYGDNYGTRMRGYLIPPATGTYTFWMAMGDSGRLVLSTDENPANATTFHEIALDKWANYEEWDKHPEQQSSNIVLQAGQPYYFELLHKESTIGDWVSVGWQGPTLSRQIISASYIAPHADNFGPVLNDESFFVPNGSANGTVVGTVTGTDINPADTIGSYTILSGNASGTFAINSGSGQITVADNTVLTNGASFSLTIQGTDDGAPPLGDTATVDIMVVDLLIDTHFESSDGFTGYPLGDHATLTTTVDNKGATWSTPDDGRIWNSSSIPPLGVQCLALGLTGTTNTVDITIPGTTHGVSNVRFDYSSFSGDTVVDFSLLYRVNGGAWVQAWTTSVSGMTPAWSTKPWPFISVDVGQEGDVDLRFQTIGTKGVLIDSVLVTAAPQEPAADPSLISTTYGTVDGADDANQAGPMWGQSITINVGASTNDAAIPQTVGLKQVSFQKHGGGTGTTLPAAAYLHVYDAFTTDTGDGSIASIGTLVAVSTNAVDITAAAANQKLTWFFAEDELDKATEYFYIVAINTAALTPSSPSLGGGFELNTGNPYTGGRAYRANGGTQTDWDMEFEVITSDISVILQPVGDIALGAPSGGNINLSWTTANGQTYNVETNADLMTPNWGILDTIIGDGGGAVVTGTTDQVRLFYRVTSD